ncbi:trypsin-like peptidase domain-containing protein [Salmonella enterica subsp. enterica serovar Wichita]|nr:trypsin-like peptidase domain-containing protein [Salmonella enterica subsp. enterica serovar Wichita]
MENYISPIEYLVHSTLRIECLTNEGTTSGTGYYFDFLVEGDSCIPCIITNKHVIAGATKGKFHLTLKKDDGTIDLGNHKAVSFDNFEEMWIQHPDSNVDLAIFLLGPLFNYLEKEGIKFHCVRLRKENVATTELLSTLSSMEEIIMIGYPNGIWDEKHNLPIIRKGITATHPKLPYNNNPEFMIDAACFPGSSGSPVFLANIGSYVDKNGNLCAGSRIALLGTLYAGPQHTTTGEIKIINIPTVNKPIAISTIPNNLGLVIQASKIDDFEKILLDNLAKE